jgi:2,3-bisphosphoglycerate-independent phosphoglycerate mutase
VQNEPKKIIVVLLDGLGDRAYPALDHRTPLQSADTPNLDCLAHRGSNGLYHPSYPGQCLPSEIAHYLLFGCDPADFPGRALLEAVGDGVSFHDDDVLCLAHLSQIEWQKDGMAVLTGGRDDIVGSREDFGKVYGLIQRFEIEAVRIRLVQTRRNDAVLLISGPVSERISDSDPIRKGWPVARIEPLPTGELQDAERTASALNAYLEHCHRILSDPQKNPYRDQIPANFLVTQRCGRRRPQHAFQTLWGLKGALIASSSVYAGLAREIGLDFIPATDTRSPGDDLRERIAQALSDNGHDYWHVHTKLPDVAAHQGNAEDKRDVISVLDRGLDHLVDEMAHRDDVLLAVTADHCTPCDSSLIHSGEPVPLLICGSQVRRDNVVTFDEIEAARGCLGMLRGAELMAMLLNYADRSNLYSHRLGRVERRYRSLAYPPFRPT